jgi:two-component system OmpR family sensor kinase
MKAGKFRSLTFQLTIWYIVILGIIVSLSGAFLYQGYKKSLVQDMDKTLREIAFRVNTIWQRSKGVTWEDSIAIVEEEYKAQQPFVQVMKLSEDNKTEKPDGVYHTKRIPDGSFLFRQDVYNRAEHADWDNLVYLTCQHKKLTDSPLRVVFLPVRRPHLIQVGLSVEKLNADLGRLTLIMALAGLLLLLFASLGGSFIIHRALVPVKSVVQTAKLITADDLTLRIDAKNRKDEIGALVETFNDMIARLDKSVKKIRRFSGDVSHELRTPLTIIRGEIEVVLRKERHGDEYKETLMSALEETHHMEKIIDDLLYLSRIETTDREKFDRNVPLHDVISRIWDGRSPSARNKGINFVIRKTGAAIIKGDRTLLERLVSNVVDNAIRYTEPGGTVEMELGEADGKAILTVRDTGIGIPEDALPFIFDRFYVVDQSRSKESGGSGLGLSIVKSVADLHHAEIDVESEVNRGTVFRLSFPLA